MARLGRLVVELAANTARFTRGIESVDRRLARFGRSASRITKLVAGAFVFRESAQLVRDVANITDKYSLMEGRLRLVQRANENLAETQTRLFKISQSTRTETTATADLYTRLARSTKELNISQNDLFTVTTAVNQAIKISGSSSASATAALFQLGQGLSAGALRGEELNSVMEQTPRLSQAIAEGMGVTIGELRKLGEQGKLTSESVVKALIAQSSVISNEYGKVPQTVGASLTLLQNEIERLVSGFGAFNKLLVSGVRNLTELTRSVIDFVNADERAADAQKQFNELIKPNEALLKQFGVSLRGLDPSNLEDVNRILRAAKLNNIDLVKTARYEEITVKIEKLQNSLAGLRIAQDAIKQATGETSEAFIQNQKSVSFVESQIDKLITAYVNLAKAQDDVAAEKSGVHTTTEALIRQEELMRSNLSTQEAANDELLRANALWQANIISLEAYTEKARKAAEAFTPQSQADSEFDSNISGSFYSDQLQRDKEAQDLLLQQDREFRHNLVKQAQEEKERQALIAKQKEGILLNSTASLFGSLASIVGQGSKKQFELSKKLARAEVIISTYASAQKSFEWASKLGGPAAGAAAAAAAIAAGLARLTAINRTSFNSSSTAATNSGAGSFVPSPTSGPITPGGQTNAAQGQTIIIITGGGTALSDDQMDVIMGEAAKRINEGSQVIIRRDSVQAAEIAAAVNQ